MEIWFARLDQKEGSSVQGGDRPVLVISNDVSNAVSSVLTVLPMTSRPKRLDLPSHTWADADKFEGLRTGALILAEQITTIGVNQLVFRIGFVKDEKTVRQIESSVHRHLGMPGMTDAAVTDTGERTEETEKEREHEHEETYDSCDDEAGVPEQPS